MRARLARLLLLLLVLAPLTPPASAAEPPAAVMRGVLVEEAGFARLALVCGGHPPSDNAPFPASRFATEVAQLTVACDIYDGSGQPSIHHERAFPGGAGVCVISAFNLVMPIEYCATVTARYRDLSQQTVTECGFAGGHPPRTAPSPSRPSVLECLDPVGVGV